MATTTPNFGWAVPTSTDLVKDGATAIETLGDSIDASLVDLKGGTTGQVLAKATNTDMDFSWVAQDDSNAIQNAIVDAKGDLIAASANDTPARLAVGANDLILTAASGETTGLKYGGAWTTWTPSYTDMTVGNATVTARYSQIGKVVFFDFKIIWGSTTSITGGNPTFTLPKASVSPVFFFDGNILDANVTNYSGAGQVVGGSSLVYMKVYNVSATYPIPGAIGSTTPMTWVSTDEYQLHGSYEVA
jgi:hypothetical protein